MVIQVPKLSERWTYAYAYVFFIAVFAGQTVRFFVGSDPLVGAQPPQIVIPVFALAVSLVLWILSPTPAQPPRGLLLLFFSLLVFIWLWSLMRDWGAFDLTALTLGPFVVLLALKSPSSSSAMRILNTLAGFALVLFALAAVFAVSTNVPPTGYTTKWPPLTDPFDPIGMWWAPFNGPAEIGAIGAVIIILGLAQRNVLRIPFVLGGGIMLFYGGTLSAALGLGIAVIVLLLAFARTSVHKRRIHIGTFALVIGMASVLVYELIDNPTVSSRSFIWSDFTNMLKEEPFWGWGSAQLIVWEQERMGPAGLERVAHGSDAHNLMFDAWIRYGLIVLIAVIAVSAAALLVSYRGWVSGTPAGLAIVTMSLAIGTTESNIWWGAPGTAYVLFILATLAGSSKGESQSTDPKELFPLRNSPSER